MDINRDYIVTDRKKHGGPRKKPIRVLIPHHNAGVVSGQGLASYIKTTTRALSATYIIGQKGEVFQGLDESLEPYTTSNRAIDTEAITFEIANSKGAPNWEISNASFDALVELSIDICKRHGIKEVSYTGDKRGNIHLHKWYASTSCPGPYVESLMPEYARRINEGLKPKPTPKPEGDKMYKIQIGAYSVKANADKALKEAIAKGYKDAYIVETGSVTKPSEPIKPAPKPVTKEYVQLSKEVTTGWRVYPLNKEPVVKNAIGSLQPHKFGGLEYEILARPMTDLVTIQTRDWGKVNIYIGKETAHKIVRK